MFFVCICTYTIKNIIAQYITKKKRHFFDEYFNWERLVGAMMHDDDDDMFERETFSQLSCSPQGVLGQANENQNYSINFNFNRI